MATARVWSDEDQIRKLSVAGFIGIVVVYLIIVQGLGRLLTAGLDVAYAAPTDLTTLWRSLTVPVLVSLVFVYAVVAVLGWWRPVLVDHGLGVTTFRVNGFPEAKVALWSSVIFGLAHATNLISEGPKAFLQVLATAIAGYFLYLIRRSSGGLLVPAVVHGLWDFGLISSSVVAGRSYVGSGLFILADIVLLIIVLVRRHQIEREPAGA